MSDFVSLSYGTTGEWACDGSKMEVEPDCFDVADGSVVSVLVTEDEGIAALMMLTPDQARQVARVLLNGAAYVEYANAQEAKRGD